MTRSILCIACSAASRIVADPGWAECLVTARIISFERSLFNGSCCNQHSENLVPWRVAVTLPIVRKPPNCPHKLTKAAEPWLGGGAALGRLQLHARVTSAAVRSCHFVLVAAAVVPLSRGRRGGRSLQLRVIALDAQTRDGR